jgi:hypothetical protein
MQPEHLTHLKGLIIWILNQSSQYKNYHNRLNLIGKTKQGAAPAPEIEHKDN